MSMDLTVKIGADTKGFSKGMKDVRGEVSTTSDKMRRAGLAAAKYGTRLAVAAAAAGAAFVAATRSAASAAKEIDNLARLSGIGTTQFQKLAAAGATVNFSQEKMADIFKDVNDKFGDFMATGAGPLADFFENVAPLVGVTADQFARLSGPEALQLYVSSLEKAGASQQQMTFYMEALASDATALVPLLRNNGREMKQFGDEAQQSGRVIDKDLIAAGVRLDRKFNEIGRTIKTKVNAALLENADKIGDLVDDYLPGLLLGLEGILGIAGKVAGGLATIASEIGAIVTAIGNMAGAVADFYNGMLEKAKKMGITLPQLIGTAAGQLPGVTPLSGPIGLLGNIPRIPQSERDAAADAMGKETPSMRAKRINAEAAAFVRTSGNTGQILPTVNNSGAEVQAAIDNLRKSVDAILEPKKEAVEQFVPRKVSSTAGAPPSVLNPPPTPSLIPTTKTKDPTKTGGGGGAGRDIADDLQYFREGLMTQAEELELWREEQLEALREFRDAKLVTEQEFNEAEKRIEQMHAEEKAQIDADAKEAKLANTREMLDGLASLMSSGNKKLHKVGQAAALAKAILEGYSAASSAWEKGMASGGPAVAAAYTAASLAKTASLISSIKSSGSSASGGVSAGGTAEAGGAAAAPAARQVDINIAGGGEFIPRSAVLRLMEEINSASDENGVMIRVV